MIRIASRAALAAASTLFLAAPAMAHMTFENAQSAPGAAFEGVLVLPHGCDGAPTDTVRVTAPEGFAEFTAQDKDGWTLEVSGQQAVWSGGSVPDDGHESFSLSGVFDAGLTGDQTFIVEQMCGDVALGWDPVVSLGGAPMASHGNGETMVGDLAISGAFVRATLPNAPVGGGYLTITNTGEEAERLVDAQSAFSPDVQIHEMAVVDDVMRMRQLPEGIEIGAGETVTLAPGGLHLMFMDLAEPFVEGETVPVTLNFEKAGDVEVELSVEAFGASSSAHTGH